MQLVGRKFTHTEFKSYLDGLIIPKWAKFVVVHNTSSPDIKLYVNDWLKRKNWTPEQWLKNLAGYYAGLGWNGTPHLFIPPTPDTILVLNALTVHGTHTPSWNNFSVGVETVGEFEREAFIDPTRDNLVTALAMLHEKFGFDPVNFVLGKSGIHFHKEDKNTTHKTCPGHNMVKSNLVHAVSLAMGLPSKEDMATHDIPMSAQETDSSELSMDEMTSVEWLQSGLNTWNTGKELFDPLDVDGIRGKKTTDAIKKFQTAMRLNLIDGIAGPVTRSTLKKELTGRS